MESILYRFLLWFQLIITCWKWLDEIWFPQSKEQRNIFNQANCSFGCKVLIRYTCTIYICSPVDKNIFKNLKILPEDVQYVVVSKKMENMFNSIRILWWRFTLSWTFKVVHNISRFTLICLSKWSNTEVLTTLLSKTISLTVHISFRSSELIYM